MVNVSHVSARRAVTDDQQNPRGTKHHAVDTEGLPVDRGYAWVIVFACLFINILYYGFFRALSILFVDFVFMFRKSVGETTLIFSFLSVTASVAAMLTQTIVVRFLSERQLVVVGGFVGGVGMILSFFAPSVYTLYVTIGVLYGITTSFLLNPTVVIITKYFNKRRSLATAISQLGGGLGFMVYPIYTHTLKTEYGARGALMVLGATFFNVMVGGMLLRPFHQNKRSTGNSGKLNVVLEEVTALTHLEDESEAGDPEIGGTTDMNHGAADNNRHHLADGSHDSQKSLHMARAVSASEVTPTPPEVTHTFINARLKLDEQKSEAGENKFKDDFPLDLSSENADRETVGENGDEWRQPAQPRGDRNPCREMLAAFDLSLLKLPLSWMFIVVSCFSNTASLAVLYLPPLAEERKISSQEVAILLTISSASSMTSRVLLGYLADLNLIRRSTLLALTLCFASVLTFLVPVYHTFTSMAIFSCIHGAFATLQMSLLPVVMVDLMGVARMSKTLGLQAIPLGATISGCHFVVGYLRDVTGSYDLPFIFLASCTMFSSLCLLATPLVERLEARMRQPTVNAQEAQ